MADLYDCHAHLHNPEFDDDRGAVVERAREAGVRRVLTVAEDLRDGERALAIADAHPEFLVPALGIHPDRAAATGDAEVAAVADLAQARRQSIGAVGEVGLDFRPCWDEAARARQREIFAAMIDLALELDLPLSVHSRSAGRHALAQLFDRGAVRVCMHGFDGRATYAEEGVRAGYLFSIPPSLVRSRVKQKLVRRLDAEALLLESDSPVLGPDPAVRNEPANLAVTLAMLADAKGTTADALSAVLAKNTAKMFPAMVSLRQEQSLSCSAATTAGE